MSTPDVEPEIQKMTPAQQRMAKARAAKAEKAAADKIVAAAQVAQAAPIQRRAAARTSSQRSQTREPPRDPVRNGRVVVTGHNGEVLTRKRTGVGDIFHVPAELIPAGWTFQWASISVYGNTEVLMDQNLHFAENGWRPVPSERYPGRFMPVGHKGPIIRGGQMLMERPEQLTKEAKAEDEANARQQMRDRDQSLLGGKANVRGAMPSGFEMGGKYRGTGGDLRMSIDRGLDIPAPSHQLADPGE